MSLCTRALLSATGLVATMSFFGSCGGSNVDAGEFRGRTERPVKAAPIDITKDGGTVFGQYNDHAAVGEGLDKLIDKDPATKYLTFHDQTWVMYKAQGSYPVHQYALTSANDFPGRDPKDWKLLGSNDGSKWTVLDAKSGQIFSDRFKTNTYTFNNSDLYSYFKVVITATADPRLAITQLAELMILSPVGPAPANRPELTTGFAAHDLAFTKSLDVITTDLEGGKFLAGESWDQVWTRDTSYSIDLACALFRPEEAKKTLMGLSENVPGIGDCWIQDRCGHFGGWPNLTDAIVGAIGAWALYRATGDQPFLAWSYPITVNSLKRGERDAFDSTSGLFKGCSSFMESNSAYPKAYANNGALLGRTKALSTNLLYYQGYMIAARMAGLLGKDPAPHQLKADQLRRAIHRRLWLADKGYYAYFEDENGRVQNAMEGAGEAFSVLWGLAADASDSVLTRTPTTAAGLPCLWPQFPEWKNYSQGPSSYYHNGMVWPFVQGYWGWAAASRGNAAVLGNELDKILALINKNDTIMEFYFPEDGGPGGSRRQLWSASGYLGMVLHGLFGMSFEPDGLRFAPVVPTSFAELRLTGIAYRGMALSITVSGHGTIVDTATLDGQPLVDAFVPASLTGAHAVAIHLK